MEYLTVKKAGEKWCIIAHMVNYSGSTKPIKGAIKKGNLWLIPIVAESRTISDSQKTGEIHIA